MSTGSAIAIACSVKGCAYQRLEGREVCRQHLSDLFIGTSDYFSRGGYASWKMRIEGGCRRKNTYKTSDIARRIGGSLSRKCGEPLYVYQCPFCGFFHLSRQPEFTVQMTREEARVPRFWAQWRRLVLQAAKLPLGESMCWKLPPTEPDRRRYQKLIRLALKHYTSFQWAVKIISNDTFQITKTAATE